MKLLLMLFILLTGFSITPKKESEFERIKVESYTETGHAQFKKLVPDNEKYNDKLLIKLEKSYIDKELNNLPRKVFGIKEKIFNKYFPATYESDTIFSRSNKTNESYVFSYNLETVHYKDVSFSISGTIGIKDVFKGKSGDITANGSMSVDYKNEQYAKTTESGKMNVVIYPGKKLTLRIIGKARVTNGISKKYFFGICIKKGAFEIVDITTAVYELVEENA